MSSRAATLSSAGHSAYVAEVRELVHDQADALFALVPPMVERLAASSAMATPPIVTRDDRTLRMIMGQCSVELEVEATIDMPDDGNRALLFPAGPARCIVRTPAGILARWDLRQVHPGGAAPVYAWMAPGVGTAVAEPAIARVIDHLLTCYRQQAA
ncbi:MAG: hypothetical protein ACRDG4_16320 [Chloroflexota bacterium]